MPITNNERSTPDRFISDTEYLALENNKFKASLTLRRASERTVFVGAFFEIGSSTASVCLILTTSIRYMGLEEGHMTTMFLPFLVRINAQMVVLITTQSRKSGQNNFRTGNRSSSNE